jgi:2'-5' RNA ligase
VQNFHVTLAFLGAVPERRICELLEIAQSVARDIDVEPAESAGEAAASGRLSITFDCIEYWKAPKVLCATCSRETPTANALSALLKARLVGRGFAPDRKSSESVGSNAERELNPHVTVAREVAYPMDSLSISPVLCGFTEFALVESRREAQGAVYRVLASFSMGP